MMRWWALVAVLLCCGGKSVGRAEEAKNKCGEEAGGRASYEVVRGPEGKKVFRIKTAFCIEGKVPKPSVIYVLNPSTVEYDWGLKHPDVLWNVVEAIRKKPF